MDKAVSQEMVLAEDPEGMGGFLRVRLPADKVAGPNRMETLPITHTYADLHVFDDRGILVNTGDRLRIEGETIKGPEGCALRVIRIALPD